MILGSNVLLLSMQVSADKKSETGTDNIIQSEQSGNTSSKKKRKDTPLLRPVRSINCTYIVKCDNLVLLVCIIFMGRLHIQVICICNDLYAPALRPLRNVAK